MGERVALVGLGTVLVYAGVLALSWPAQLQSSAAATALLFLLAVVSDATAVWTRSRGGLSLSFVWLITMAQLSGVGVAVLATGAAGVLTLGLWARESGPWARLRPLLPELFGAGCALGVLALLGDQPSHGFPAGLPATVISLLVYGAVSSILLNALFDQGQSAAHRGKLKHYRGVAFLAPACILLGALNPRFTLWMIPLVYGLSQFTWPGDEELKLFESRTVGLRDKLKESKHELHSTSRALKTTRSQQQETSRALRNLERHKDEMIQVSKMSAVGNLAAGLAHQVNTPLASILVAVEAAQRSLKRGKEEAAAKRLEQCKDATKQAQKIVQELLAYSRSEDFHNEPVRLSELVCHTTAQLGELLDRNRVELVQRLDQQAMVLGHQGLLEQALSNLIVNSVDAMKKERRVLSLTIVGGARTHLLQISDTGEGVADEIVDRIFEPFFSSKAVGKGTGLGLYFSREIANRHGGRLTLLESTTKGSTFQLELPASDSRASSI